MKINTWTIAQAQLIPDPNFPAIGVVGFAEITKYPGKLRWKCKISSENGQLGSPDYCVIAVAITEELQPGTARILLNPYPPPGPISEFDVGIVGVDGVTVLSDPIIGSVQIRIDRKGPGLNALGGP